ncbi:WD repeat-containing protein 86-like [Dysidea avara]|uniref:WD repeat-containing protein 86-like n=1 Tax=Dysidea avara TaxID=196820 RepID=UPI00332EBD5D
MATSEPDRELFTGSSDGTARSWNVETGQPLRVFEGHQAPVTCMQLSGSLLFTGSADCMARCWQVEYAEYLRVYRGHQSTVNCVIAQDDVVMMCNYVIINVVFANSRDGLVLAWGIKTDICRKLFKGHSYPINCMQVHGDRLYSGSYDKAVKVWDISFLDNSLPGTTV